jgi:hypothetical protein
VELCLQRWVSPVRIEGVKGRPGAQLEELERKLAGRDQEAMRAIARRVTLEMESHSATAPLPKAPLPSGVPPPGLQTADQAGADGRPSLCPPTDERSISSIQPAHLAAPLAQDVSSATSVSFSGTNEDSVSTSPTVPDPRPSGAGPSRAGALGASSSGASLSVAHPSGATLSDARLSGQSLPAASPSEPIASGPNLPAESSSGPSLSGAKVVGEVVLRPIQSGVILSAGPREDSRQVQGERASLRASEDSRSGGASVSDPGGRFPGRDSGERDSGSGGESDILALLERARGLLQAQGLWPKA